MRTTVCSAGKAKTKGQHSSGGVKGGREKEGRETLVEPERRSLNSLRAYAVQGIINTSQAQPSQVKSSQVKLDKTTHPNHE